MNKRDLVKQLKTSLEREIEVLERAARSAREAATHEESRPENDKDTRAVEAAYLAGAQADRARDLGRALNALEFLPLRAFREEDPIAASALIEIEVDGKRCHYFLAPQGGGLGAEIEGVTVLVITPESPMGRALLGKSVGDVVELRTEGRAREVEILAVEQHERLMLACVDVNYEPRGALAACVLFRAWADPAPARELVARIDEVLPYEPGAFYRRELPCLLAVLGQAGAPLATVVIDGYVWLSRDGRPGLGARLFEALGGSVPVIGVAKTAFQGSDFAAPLLRGSSEKPLFITAAGIEPGAAVDHIRGMDGAHRIPTLLRRVDRLCRDGR